LPAALALLLAPGALAASLKAGGLTASGRALGEQAANAPPVLRMGDMTLVGGRVPTINVGGQSSVYDNLNSRHSGGITLSGGALGPFQNEGGNVYIDQWHRRRLAEQAGASASGRVFPNGAGEFAPLSGARSVPTRFIGSGAGLNPALFNSFESLDKSVTTIGFGLGRSSRSLGEQAAASANANIMAIGGRTSGFAPSDRAPITNFGGATTFTSAGVGFNGGLTTSFDNFGNPVANEGGRGQIFRRLGEQAADSNPPANAGAAIDQGVMTFAQQQQWAQQMMGGSQQQQQWAQQAMGGAQQLQQQWAQQMMDATPQMQQWQQAQQERQKAVAAAAAVKPAIQGTQQGAPMTSPKAGAPLP
jgi:hypothetical protein